MLWEGPLVRPHVPAPGFFQAQRGEETAPVNGLRADLKAKNAAYSKIEFSNDGVKSIEQTVFDLGGGESAEGVSDDEKVAYLRIEF